MPLPDPTGPHRVGIIEADVPAPTDAGVVPVVVYYPAIDEPDAPPSTALCGATSSEPEQLRWLDARYAAALGKSHLLSMTLQRVLREAPPLDALEVFKAIQKRNASNSEARGMGDADVFVLRANHLGAIQAQFASTAGACLLGVEATGSLEQVTSFTVIFGHVWRGGRSVEETEGIDEAMVPLPPSEGRSLDEARKYIMRHGRARLSRLYHGLRNRGEINDGDLIELHVWIYFRARYNPSRTVPNVAVKMKKDGPGWTQNILTDP